MYNIVIENKNVFAINSDAIIIDKSDSQKHSI